MTTEQFAYWMQGFAELTGDTPPTVEQWKSMREHLATVFHKVTPPVTLPPFDTSRTGAPPFRMPYEVTCSTLAGGVAAPTFC